MSPSARRNNPCKSGNFFMRMSAFVNLSGVLKNQTEGGIFCSVHLLWFWRRERAAERLALCKQNGSLSCRHVWNLSSAMYAAGRAYIHTLPTQCISRICTELNKHLPSNTGLPGYCFLGIKRAWWYEGYCVCEWQAALNHLIVSPQINNQG